MYSVVKVINDNSFISTSFQGLAGSSAIVTATLKCLMQFFNLTENVGMSTRFMRENKCHIFTLM